MASTVDVAVVGGGVIGCSVAYHAARCGASVALFEAGRIASGASGAAAGMLAAQAEAHEPGPLLDLLLESRGMHRALGEELYEKTGLDSEHVWVGTMRVAADEEARERLQSSYLWQRERGLCARWLGGEEARELEPALSPRVLAALYLPEDGQVNSPWLVRALALAAELEGARVEEFARVDGLLMRGSHTVGVRTAEGETAAGSVVLAGGVWSAALAASIGASVPVFPVKGEILSVLPRKTLIRANVWEGRCYMVPKRDGRVMIGATEEPGSYDPRPTLGGVATLSSAAVELVPGVSGARFAEAWGGLRPGTPDGRPILGPVEGRDGLLLAVGHYRNGVLLAPITGQTIAALALGEPPSADVSPFHLQRLAGVVKL